MKGCECVMPKGKIVTTPKNAATRWGNNLKAATAKIKEGVQAVETAPGADAAAAKAAWVAAMSSAEVQDRWAKNVAAVTKEQWQNAMINKGIPNIATGVNNAIPKVQTFLANLFASMQNVLDNLPKSRATFQDRMSRVTQFLDAMHNLKGKIPRG